VTELFDNIALQIAGIRRLLIRYYYYSNAQLNIYFSNGYLKLLKI